MAPRSVLHILFSFLALLSWRLLYFIFHAFSVFFLCVSTSRACSSFFFLFDFLLLRHFPPTPPPSDAPPYFRSFLEACPTPSATGTRARCLNKWFLIWTCRRRPLLVKGSQGLWFLAPIPHHPLLALPLRVFDRVPGVVGVLITPLRYNDFCSILFDLADLYYLS